MQSLPWRNAFWPGLTPFGPLLWQAEADTELTKSASPTTAVGQKALALAKRRYSTVFGITGKNQKQDTNIDIGTQLIRQTSFRNEF